ncbi:MAG: DUF362 domain-containing protein [Sedimentisphaerales bacterium]|nr:DUF362 domain-containing protein [Sedimentisphaerales bacterium]
MTAHEVAVSVGHGRYPSEPPYSPGSAYPEYPFGSDSLTQGGNEAYDGVRDALRLLKLDEERYGRKEWNPFGRIVRPGDTVVLKPNFIRNFRETQRGHEDCLITHGSLIRAAMDYVYIALQGRGRAIIADAPQNDADFAAIRQIAGLDEIQAFYRRQTGFDVEVYDLRPEKARKMDGVIVGHERLAGDPRGYVKVDLGPQSIFAEIEPLCHLLYGSEYDTSEIRRHHTGGVHEYLISRTVLEADCIINLPKLKTHKKTGITVCMKNLVGINGDKNWLPHHRLGTPACGGDQFADNGARRRIEGAATACFRKTFPLLGPLRRIVARPLKKLGKGVFGDTNTDTIRSGNWYGNDTTWRMVIDLNRILMYADQNGGLQNRPMRGMFCLVDGIVGGEGNGPLDATPKRAGVVVAGMNPAAVDLTCATLMGFDPDRLPLIRRAWQHACSLPLAMFHRDQVTCRSEDVRFDGLAGGIDGTTLRFEPHFGWRGHVETHADTARCATDSG